jgi:hypothetical protein
VIFLHCCELKGVRNECRRKEGNEKMYKGKEKRGVRDEDTKEIIPCRLPVGPSP